MYKLFVRFPLVKYAVCLQNFHLLYMQFVSRICSLKVLQSEHNFNQSRVISLKPSSFGSEKMAFQFEVFFHSSPGVTVPCA
jgi:hypothetical protein